MVEFSSIRCSKDVFLQISMSMDLSVTWNLNYFIQPVLFNGSVMDISFLFECFRRLEPIDKILWIFKGNLLKDTDNKTLRR